LARLLDFVFRLGQNPNVYPLVSSA
jgi:hypothetical protein